MSSEDYYGYTGLLARKLKEAGAVPGDVIRLKSRDEEFEGVLMPRFSLYRSDEVVVIKLGNGYNVGIRLAPDSSIEVVRKSATGVQPRSLETKGEGKRQIVLLGTGGTIASKIDYRTGAVYPSMSPEDIVEWIPEIQEIAPFEAREVMNVFSEDITPKDWARLAEEIYNEMNGGALGVVVAHGTDMMAYSAAAMAFAIANKPVPIVFVGAQRSSDRPSTDSAINLKAAFITAARAPFAESTIAMHGGTGDEFALVHRGVKARKMHTSRRDAFQSVNDRPLALVNLETGELKVIGRIYEERDPGKKPVLMNKFEDRVALIKAYPGFQPEVLEMLMNVGIRGVVIEGSGLGHIANRAIDSIRKLTEAGIPVVMTSQCLFGRVNLNVYSTGRRLLEAGAIPGSDMLPETAFVKLSWILGNFGNELEKVKELMLKNFVGEINPRHTLDLFPRWYHG
ncbi:MAG: Glu-tRNA(Gln) amidotransferase subunit GatD [Desulfurococcaceae archaeon]